MTGYGQVNVKRVWKMLDKCLDGYKRIEGAHKWIIKHGDKEFLQISLGPHGSRNSGNTPVEKGQLRSLVRTFEIEDCAKKYFPEIKSKKKSPTSPQS